MSSHTSQRIQLPCERIIDGQKYTFCFIDVEILIELITEIGQIIGPGLGASLKGNVSDLMNADLDLGALLSGAFDRITPKQAVRIVKDTLVQTIHAGDGKLSDNFSLHFNKFGVKHVFKVFFEAAKVYYSDFFPKGLGKQSILENQ